MRKCFDTAAQRQKSSPAVVLLRVTEKSQVKMKELKCRLPHHFAFVHLTDDVEDVTFHITKQQLTSLFCAADSSESCDLLLLVTMHRFQPTNWKQSWQFPGSFFTLVD